jgi:hypothetical protein
MTDLKLSLPRLRALLLTQRTLRLLLRAVWTGLAGYLIGWGINDINGALPDSNLWLAIGFALALLSLLTMFLPLRMSRLTWNLDRQFGLREQLSAAWQTAQQPEQTRISSLLLSDADALLPAQRTRILRWGWFLSRDVLAALLVAALFFTVNTFVATEIPLATPDSAPLDLPPLAEAPTYDDLFPSGIPGLTQSQGNDPGQSDPLTPDQASSLDDILSELGDALSENPETAPAGEALQQGDLEKAAAEIERLADELDSLPEEARENVEAALQRAAEQAEQTGQQDLADALEQAADSLDDQNPNNLEAAEALDDLASEFRKLEDQFASMGQAGDQEPATEPAEGEQQANNSEGGNAAGTGNGSEGQSEPIERLEGEGNTVEITGDETPSGLLGSGEATGTPTNGDGGPIIAGGGGPGDPNPIQSILTPYNFPWRWRDVVSKYFSPPQ